MSLDVHPDDRKRGLRLGLRFDGQKPAGNDPDRDHSRGQDRRKTQPSSLGDRIDLPPAPCQPDWLAQIVHRGNDYV
jgi:hypothetical protein